MAKALKLLEATDTAFMSTNDTLLLNPGERLLLETLDSSSIISVPRPCPEALYLAEGKNLVP
jgi:hypothetical protein